jgi:hypothetical protein
VVAGQMQTVRHGSAARMRMGVQDFCSQ